MHGAPSAVNIIRSLTVDGGAPRAVIMPRRAGWADWGYSNAVTVKLKKGRHTIDVFYTPADDNMNKQVNEAHVDFLELIRTR